MTNATITTKTLTTKARWNKAIKQLRETVEVKQNVKGCCHGCLTLKWKNTKAPVAYTYGGQDQNYSWDNNGEIMHRGVIYFNHDNGAAQAIVDAFTANGFKATWDGQDWSSVVVSAK